MILLGLGQPVIGLLQYLGVPHGAGARLAIVVPQQLQAGGPEPLGGDALVKAPVAFHLVEHPGEPGLDGVAVGGLSLGPLQHGVGHEGGPVALDVGRGRLVLGDGHLAPGDPGVELANIEGPDDELGKQLVTVHQAAGQIALHIGAVLGQQGVSLHLHPIADAAALAQAGDVLLQRQQLQVQAVGHGAAGLAGDGRLFGGLTGLVAQLVTQTG
ncbi:hypothetical protein D3C73_756220 [compost metagenome]